jgi:small-conductance mechanosensitive channel
MDRRNEKWLRMESLQQIWKIQVFEIGGGNFITVGQIVFGVLFLVIGSLLCHLVARVVRGYLLKSGVNPTAAAAAQKIIFYVLLTSVFMTTLHFFQIPVTFFAFLGGAAAIGIGFGAQNLLNNFISGWILIAERPVRLGDLIEVEEHLGFVENIGTRCTRLRRVDGIDVLVPNSYLLEHFVVNWTFIEKTIRTSVRVGVQYGSPVEKVRELMMKIAMEAPEALKDPEPIVIFEDFGDNSLIFDVFFWCQVTKEMQLRKIRSDIRFEIEKAFKENKIVVAFPQRDVHLNTESPLVLNVTRAARATE